MDADAVANVIGKERRLIPRASPLRCGCGEISVYAPDLKSDDGNIMWVRLPPAVPKRICNRRAHW